MDLRHINPKTIKLIDWNKILDERKIQWKYVDADADGELSGPETDANQPERSVEGKSGNKLFEREPTKRVVFNLETNNYNESNFRILSTRRRSNNPAFVNYSMSRPNTTKTVPASRIPRASTTATNNFRKKKIPIEETMSPYLNTPELYKRRNKSNALVEERTRKKTASTLLDEVNQNFSHTERDLTVYEVTIEERNDKTEESNTDIKVNSSGDIQAQAVSSGLYSPPKQPQLPQVSILKHNPVGIGDVETNNSPIIPEQKPEKKIPSFHQINYNHPKTTNPWDISIISMQFIKKLYIFLICLLIGTGSQLLVLGNYEIQFMKTGLEKSFIGYETWIQNMTGILALAIGFLSIYIEIFETYKLLLWFSLPGTIILLILNIISIGSTGVQYTDVDNYIDDLVKTSREDFDSADWEALNYIQIEFSCCGGHQGFQDYQTDQLPKSCCFQYAPINTTIPNCTKASLETGYLKEASCSKLVNEYVQLMSYNAHIILGYTTVIIILFLAVGLLFLRKLKAMWKYYSIRSSESQ